jgi:gliding motility-associated-like protein
MISPSLRLGRAGVTVACTLLAVLLHAQSFVHRYRFSTGNVSYTTVCPLSDGRIVAGGLATFPNDRAVLSMLDAEGAVIWSRNYGDQQASMSIQEVAETPAGDLLVLINASLSFSRYSILARISAADGQLIDAKRMISAPRYTAHYHLLPLPDGYLLAGVTSEEQGFFSLPESFSLVKVDFNGNIVWQREVLQTDLNFSGTLIDAVVGDNGDIWAIAVLENPFTPFGQVGLLHFDPEGNWLASFRYQATAANRVVRSTSIDWQPGVGPLLGGTNYLDDSSGDRPWLAQLDTSGAVVWSKVLATQPSAYISALVHRLPDGNFVSLCASGGAPTLGLLVKFDGNGNLFWSRDFTSNAFVESLGGAILDAQGNLFAAGTAFTPLPELERQGCVLRTDDPNFDTAACCSRSVTTQTLNVGLAVTPFINNTSAVPITPSAFTLQSTSFSMQRLEVCSSQIIPDWTWSRPTACPGQCVTLRLAPSDTSTYTLTVPGALPATTTFSDSVTLCFPTEGVYTVLLENGNCRRRTGTFEVKQRVPPPFALSDSLVCPGRCVTLIPPTDADPDEDYRWSFVGGQPDTLAGLTPSEVCFPQVGTYTLRLYIEGCGFTSQPLTVSSSPFRIPNAFTPDGDGLNDVFRPLLECPEGEYTMEVYNRWGQRIFTSNDPEVGWDGRVNNNAAPVDVYVWLLHFGEVDENGQVLNRVQNGEVTLLR